MEHAARTNTETIGDQGQQQRQPVRVAPLCITDAAGWDAFRGLCGRYVAALEHPWPPTVTMLMMAAAETGALLAWRGSEPVGFAMAEPRFAGTGRRCYWLSHFYCPDDWAAARELERRLVREAAELDLEVIAFESGVPAIARVVALAGYRPMATVYGKEL